MAVRTFDYEGCKNIITQVQEKANTIKTILNECDMIVTENVGVPRKWTGVRADNFKTDWKKISENFDKFIELLSEYSTVIEQAYEQYQNVDS